jgi:hypothetical protein
MPPRYAFWTILIDNAPTAFRAADRDDLLPTLHQLRRKNADVVLKWFARGRLWDSPEAAQEAAQAKVARERRGRDWRPGGTHKDPRARFDKEARRQQKREARRPPSAGPRDRRPWQPKGPPGGQRPWRPKGDQRWQAKGDRSSARPPDRGAKRPWNDRPKHKPFGGARRPGEPYGSRTRRRDDEDEKKTKG